MSKSELLVGLDIGTTKICAVVGEVNDNGSINIVGVGHSPSTGLRKGVVVNIEQTVQSIRQAIEEAEAMVGCEIGSVYAGIAGSHISGINSHGVIAIKSGEVTQKDLERVLDAAKAIALPLDREVLHVLPQEYVVDGQAGIIDPIGMSGVRLEANVHIVTGTITSAQNIMRSCAKSNLDVTDIVLEALASSKAISTDEEREIGVAIIDIGGGTSDIAIFVNNTIKYTSSVPLGGQNLTNDIAFGLRTPTAAAEKIKVKHGCCLGELVHPEEIIEVPSVGGRPARHATRRVLTAMCEPRMEEIFFRIDQEIVRSGLKDKIRAGTVLTGGTSLIEGAAELAEQVFGMPTRVGGPQNLGSGFIDMVNSPKFSTAVGLLFYGLENERNPDPIIRRNSGDSGSVSRVISKMKKWFSDVK